MNIEKKGFVIAIDGPVASGKGTIAPKLAEKIDGIYLYTGGTYRALALYCIQNHIDMSKENQIIEALPNVTINLKGETVLLNGVDVTENLKTPEVAKGSSVISVFGGVREAMIKVQQEVANREVEEGKIVIAEGRDTGTRVFPNAHLKIFLTAKPSVRAKRRLMQYKEKGIDIGFEKVLQETIERDKRDSEREVDPLTKEPEKLGYVIIDSSNQAKEQTIGIIVETLKKSDILI